MTEAPVAVLDASALVALVRRERGWETVQKIIRAGAVTTPTGLAEALTVLRRARYNRPADDLLDDLGELGLEVEPLVFDDAITMTDLLEVSDSASERDARIGKLSLGDVACLAVARRLNLPAIASDGTWEVLDSGVQILPFR